MKSVNPCGLMRAALINDLSCFGKCSLSVSMPILSSFGVETVPLPTAILSTHTGGFTGFVVQDMTENMRLFAAHWKKLGVKFDAIITGYCCTVEQIKLTAEFIRSFSDTDTLVIVDPVLGDHEALYTGFTDAHVDAMRELCSLADLITPNRTEAALLAGLSFSSADETLLYAQQVKDAVITSVGSGNRIGYLARLDGRVTLVQKESVDMTVHGAGDVFTSALSGELLSGQAPQTALLRAADFCDSCIHETVKRQPDHWKALKGVSMNIPEKSITALIGPSGCGKSTFLKTLDRMNDLVPGVRIEGEVKYNGQDIFAPSVDINELRREIGMVFQKPNPFPMSIYDNITYGPRTHGVRKKDELDEIVEQSLRGAAIWDEVKDRLKKSALGLSGGQQQRLCIARALAVQPQVLLMDEPTSALDPISTSKIEELATNLKEQYTIIIVTHNMQQALRISDKTAFFLLGELIEYDDTQKLFYQPKEKRTEDYITGRFG